MNVSKNNLKFEYLYRSTGNYKEFGELIFANPNNLNSEKATSILKSKLIDEEYFYPSRVGIPKLNRCDFQFDTEWYEFIKFSDTDEDASANVDIENFISTFNTK